MKIKTFLYTLILSLFIIQPVMSADDDHADHSSEDKDKSGEHDEGTIKLSSEQLQTAGIVVSRLTLQSTSANIEAPAEVALNAYRSIKVTPRVPSQVIKRHAQLGDVVKKGQVLVTLSSVEMAEAQSDLLAANLEWLRVKKLGQKVVSGRRFSEATIARSQALAKVKAYGMMQTQINRMLKGDSRVQPDGTFQLVSSIEGRVLEENFIVGERVEPGKELMLISDESVMWAEARITPDQAGLIQIGNTAQIISGKKVFSAKVTQIHHSLDETTRTIAVRMEINNPDDFLHPGMFVNAVIQSSNTTMAFELPEAAVLRSPDGDWQVIVQQDEPGEFKFIEVELVRVSSGKAIIKGLKNDTLVVTKGAFFVQSELAKSGFEIHNH